MKKNQKIQENHEIRTTLKSLQRVSEHDTIPSRTLVGEKFEIKFGPLPSTQEGHGGSTGGLVPANPFASRAQAGYMHSHPEILGKAGLAEWDASSKGKSLPKHVSKKK